MIDESRQSRRPASFGRRAAMAWLAAAPALLAGRAAHAQAGAIDGPITLVVPFAAGGPTDVSARLVAPELSSRLGVPVVVENRSGAGGGIGLRYVQNVAPSLANRTILVGSTSTQTVLPLMDPQQVGFNPVEEMVPIGLLGTYYTLLATSVASGITSLADLKGRTAERLAYGSPGANSEGHLMHLLFTRALGATGWEHVPYRGSAPALTALMANEVQIAFASPISAQPLLQSGRARALAVTSGTRSPLFPDLPTLRESGVDLVLTGFFGLVGPKGMTPAVADALGAATNAVLQQAELRQKLDGLGLQAPGPQGRAEFLEFQRAEYRRFAPFAPSGSAG